MCSWTPQGNFLKIEPNVSLADYILRVRGYGHSNLTKNILGLNSRIYTVNTNKFNTL